MRKLVTGIAALCLALLLALLPPVPARAEGERAGDFAYYVLALGWSSSWCRLDGDARRDRQCEAGRGLTFTLHGLWPQDEAGYPSYCRTGQADPSRAATAAMADIIGGAGLAFHQWKKHGRCSGLSAQGYYRLMRAAWDGITLPAFLAGVDQDLHLPAKVVEAAFLEANPGLGPDQITITCKAGMIREARICLTKDLAPRRCGADVIGDCTLPDALLPAVR